VISRLENEYEQHGNNLSPAKVLAKNSSHTDVVAEKNLKFSSTKSEKKKNNGFLYLEIASEYY
jgi:hypothetical protein